MNFQKLMLSFLTLLLISSTTTIYAQRTCGAMDHLHQLQNTDPKMMDKMEDIEKHTQRIVNNPDNRAVNGIITIPVVVHVIYSNSNENISVAQIQSQLDVLNQDFRRTNPDATNNWSQAADTEIEFCLASIDPNGNATSGITRKSSTRSEWGTNDAMKSASQGGVNAWPTSDYLNMWICNIGGGILGYAQFPGGAASTDGVVMSPQYFGTTGYVSAPFDGGRTTTHEVGHWLNLRHIWGDGNCNADDYVSDTPTSDAANYGCATGHTSCNSTDMVENYMDYSDDACMNLFTQGQKTRMRALFESGGFRASLLNSNGCGGGGGSTPTCSDGIQNGNETGVDCGGSCAPCQTACNDNEITITITFDNYPEETSWAITNSSGQTVASGGTYGSQADGSTLTETVCLADGCYDFVISDAYGDGICCSYGNGSYSVTGGGTTHASGGSFGSSETTNFCLNNAPAPTCNDGVQNGDETGVDCGGSNCSPCATCNDGIQNGNETGVDCGGSCAPCVTCNDGVQNGDETGVDCGGSNCAPCNTGGCNDTEVSITITFDNYSSETSWSITDANGQTVASGGNYNQASGSSVTETACLPDGCYDFTINDAYGDGICCSYGNGSYSVSSDGTTHASGGSFGSSETTNFCIGSSGGGGGGGGTGGGACSNVTIDSEGFESGWGIWNDGGSDSYRGSTSFANTGSYAIRLRDNTSTSTMTTDNLNLNGYEEVTVDFSYIAVSMENGEDFWLQFSLDGGSTYQTVAVWARGADFNNNERKYETVTVTGTFTSTTKVRFRCDASGNADYIYIDDVTLTGCVNSTRQESPTEAEEKPLAKENSINLEALRLFPNPASQFLNVGFELTENTPVEIQVLDLTGKIVQFQSIEASIGKQETRLEVGDLDSGFYILQVVTNNGRLTEKFLVVK